MTPAQAKMFIDSFGWVSKEIHETAKAKGWWDTERNDGEMIALMHSELSEALEGLRKNLQDDHLPQYKMVEVELADCIIRIMDMAPARSYRLAEAILAKMTYNAERPHRHGGKKF